MSAPDDQINEVAPEGSTASAFDDIYVPGIGVRGALSDDAAEGSDFRSNIGEAWIRWAGLVNGRAIGTARSVRRIGSRLVVKVTNIDIRSKVAVKHIQIQTAERFRGSPSAISETVAQNFRRTRSFLSNVVVDTRNRLRVDASYRVMLRAFVNCRPHLPTLRRTAAPLAILLIMVVFIVQQIAVAVKH